MNQFKQWIPALALGTLALLSAPGAQAVCEQTAADPMDVSVYRSFAVEHCSPERTYNYVAEFNLSSFAFGLDPGWLSSFGGGAASLAAIDRGWDHPCNINYELMKHWAAGAVVKYGTRWEERHVQPGIDVLLNRAFHHPYDYLQLSVGNAGDDEFVLGLNFWHPNYVHRVTDSVGSYYGRYTWETDLEFNPFPRLDTDHAVTHGCYAFSPSLNAGADPVYRASSFVHEGWHAHFGKGTADDHTPNKNGECGIRECDYFYPHPKDAFAEKELRFSAAGSMGHSSNQLQMEFLCDLSDLPAAWIGFELRSYAAGQAKDIGDTRFIGGKVPYSCGVPTPMLGQPPLRFDNPGSADCREPCATSVDCSGNGECHGGCCVWVG